MMTRRLKVSLLSSLAILGLGIGFAGALPAAAATTDTSSSSDSSSSSSATTMENTTTSADFTMDPNAAVSLDSAPNISFGSNPAPNGKVNGNYFSTTVDNPLEVSNPGVATGWSVQLKNTPFTDTAGDTLNGAVLSLGDASVDAANEGNPSATPIATISPLEGGSINQLVFAAEAKGGLGVWDATYAPAKVNLTVPAGQLPGDYTSTLTWQLSETPQ
ncbi:WxL domain-containing protein [Levilactobacillus wangkuiensis]|uniref:WxL domain-containing protein n=2 Tax=Levilactobacillus wangkuiensis TaxID=2799566 RepID=UPI001CED4D43|nr:WxL domain-containing protein [Levilactobacillus wangkuiensis]